MALLPCMRFETPNQDTMSNLQLPSPPFIDAPGLANLRDAGGYPVGEPATAMVRRGLLFRSAKPVHHTETDGLNALRQLGIKNVYDLRSVTELASEGALESAATLPNGLDGAQRVFAPVFMEQDYSPAAIASRFKSYSSGAEVSPSYKHTHTHTHTHTMSRKKYSPRVSPFAQLHLAQVGLGRVRRQHPCRPV